MEQTKGRILGFANPFLPPKLPHLFCPHLIPLHLFFLIPGLSQEFNVISERLRLSSHSYLIDFGNTALNYVISEYNLHKQVWEQVIDFEKHTTQGEM